MSTCFVIANGNDRSGTHEPADVNYMPPSPELGLPAVADAAGMGGGTGRPDMARRCQFCRNGSSLTGAGGSWKLSFLR